MFRSLLVAFALLVATPVAASAQIYRYEEEDGTSLYTTEPIAGRTPVAVFDDEPSSNSPRPSIAAAEPERPNPNPDRQPSAFDDIIREASEQYSIPFEFIKAVIRVESAFDPHAVSHAGAMGLMQLMPATAESMNCADPFDPRENIMAGTRYLQLLSNRYNGDINLVLSGYNAGSGAVALYDGIPYEATRRYVERVYGYYQDYLAASIDDEP